MEDATEDSMISLSNEVSMHTVELEDDSIVNFSVVSITFVMMHIL